MAAPSLDTALTVIGLVRSVCQEIQTRVIALVDAEEARWHMLQLVEQVQSCIRAAEGATQKLSLPEVLTAIENVYCSVALLNTVLLNAQPTPKDRSRWKRFLAMGRKLLTDEAGELLKAYTKHEQHIDKHLRNLLTTLSISTHNLVGDLHKNSAQQAEAVEQIRRMLQGGSLQHGQPLRAFLCPLTGQLMQDPVTVMIGAWSVSYTYEREAIESHLARKGTDPLSGVEVRPTADVHNPWGLVPNDALRAAIDEWRLRCGSSSPPQGLQRQSGGSTSPTVPAAQAGASSTSGMRISAPASSHAPGSPSSSLGSGMSYTAPVLLPHASAAAGPLPTHPSTSSASGASFGARASPCSHSAHTGGVAPPQQGLRAHTSTSTIGASSSDPHAFAGARQQALTPNMYPPVATSAASLQSWVPGPDAWTKAVPGPDALLPSAFTTPAAAEAASAAAVGSAPLNISAPQYAPTMSSRATDSPLSPPRLVAELSGPQLQTATAAAANIYSLVSCDATFRDELVREGAVPRLLGVMSQPCPNARLMAVRALSSLTDGHADAVRQVDDDGIKRLVGLLEPAGDQQVHLYALRTLKHLAAQDDARRCKIQVVGGVAAMMQLLSLGSPDVQRAAKEYLQLFTR